MTWTEVTFTIGKDLVDLISEYLTSTFNKGCLICEDTVKFYFSSDELSKNDLNKIQKDLEKLIGRKIDIETKTIESVDWLLKWKENFKPLEVGKRFLILPPWEEVKNTERIMIYINPGMAFGTGHHATTRMMLEEMEWLYERGYFAGKDVLDLGTGSGILAIASHFLNANSILALDNDPEIRENLLENLSLNSLKERIDIHIGELKEVNRIFDIILANIDLFNLLSLKKEIINSLKVNGYLIVSGILSHQRDELLNSYSKQFELIHENIDKDGEWTSLVLGKLRDA